MDILRQDLRYALRVFLKNPGFTVIAVVTLAFGIGANTAIFNVVNAVLLHPLPFKAPDRLVLLWQTNPRASFPQLPFSFPNFTGVKEQSQFFEDVGAWSASADTRFNLSGELEPEQIQAARVSASFFQSSGSGRFSVASFSSQRTRRAVLAVLLSVMVYGSGVWAPIPMCSASN